MNEKGETQARSAFPWWRRRWAAVLGSLLAALCLGFVLAAEYLLHHAEPILRKRITETLAARFNAPVTLDALHLSLLRGIEVEGDNLKIGYSENIAPFGHTAVPMIAVAHFRFRTGLRALVGDTLAHRPLHIANVRIEGLDLHIPPRNRNDRQPANRTHEPENDIVLVDQLECRDVRLFLERATPGSENAGKPPLQFNIPTLTLQHVGKHQAMLYDARLINPKPAGAIHVTGHFGPWANQTSDEQPASASYQPSDTPIDGDYTFDHADLATIKGLGGTLDSTGHFTGTLNRLLVDGNTDTPNFSLSVANHPTPLHTDFHAIVDGTNGDTYLQPVHAHLGDPLAGSAFTTSGKIVRVQDRGHDIQLDVEVPHGHIQDFLRLAVKTSPPLLNGTLALHARMHIPTGDAPVPQRLSLVGTFNITAVQFSNPRWQHQVENLSARATGHPEQANLALFGHQPTTSSQLSANVTLDSGILSVSDLRYSVPGVLALMNGVYSTDGRLFEFKGHVRTDATASQMVGGWKGLLLSPFDQYLQKNGAGVELPVEISGTQGDLHFGLATQGADDKPAQLLTDIREKSVAKQQRIQGRDLFAEAKAEDIAAAHASTLEEAERHHNNAVGLRAEAQAKAAAAANIR